MRIGIANAAEVDAIWPLISVKMQDGCDRTGGAVSSADLWQMCRSGNAFLLVGMEEEIRIASVWRFENWPSGPVFRCLGLCGSRPDEWIESLYDFALSQARTAGVKRLVAEGRKGWPRILQRYLKRQITPLWQTFEVQ